MSPLTGCGTLWTCWWGKIELSGIYPPCSIVLESYPLLHCSGILSLAPLFPSTGVHVVLRVPKPRRWHREGQHLCPVQALAGKGKEGKGKAGKRKVGKAGEVVGKAKALSQGRRGRPAAPLSSAGTTYWGGMIVTICSFSSICPL